MAHVASATALGWAPLTSATASPTSGDEGGLVGPAPVGHRRQERGVGLDQQPVERAQLDRLAHLGRPLEGDDAAEGQVGAQVEAPTGLVGPAGEAVDHRALRHALGLEDVEGLGPGLAGVDDQRQVVGVGQGDLGGERPRAWTSRGEWS